MKPILVLIIGLPLVAAIGISTSMLDLFAAGCLFLIALWISAGRQQPV